MINNMTLYAKNLNELNTLVEHVKADEQSMKSWSMTYDKTERQWAIYVEFNEL